VVAGQILSKIYRYKMDEENDVCYEILEPADDTFVQVKQEDVADYCCHHILWEGSE